MFLKHVEFAAVFFVCMYINTPLSLSFSLNSPMGYRWNKKDNLEPIQGFTVNNDFIVN